MSRTLDPDWRAEASCWTLQRNGASCVVRWDYAKRVLRWSADLGAARLHGEAATLGVALQTAQDRADLLAEDAADVEEMRAAGIDPWGGDYAV